MNGGGKSYKSVVPRKPSNKAGGAPLDTERVEGRDLAKGTAEQQNSPCTQRQLGLQSELARIRQIATKDKKVQFTALWHHVYNIERLREAYLGLKRNSAAGVDGVSWEDYQENIERNLEDLSDRLARGAYRAKPVSRRYIPKADGKQRPIGIPTLEDKIVQRSTIKVLEAIYEADFKAFSYGFRPGKSQHNALDALSVGITRRKVNWILDADIRSFFDTIDHEWLIRFIEHRIKDKRVTRHVKKWLNAGVLENGHRLDVEQGTPQGGSISPLLANIYLHYVFDLWIDAWRRHEARGNVIVVRYADDLVLGFQYRSDAVRLLEEMRERFRKFNLELHPQKTRIVEFGSFAAKNRKDRSGKKPEVFHFLGFTHVCSRTRKNGKFIVLRQTERKRMLAKLRVIRKDAREKRHKPIPEQGAWLSSVLRGHYQYYAVPLNAPSLARFHYRVRRIWHKALLRRSQKHHLPWERMDRIARRYLPVPRISHPYPWERLRVGPAART